MLISRTRGRLGNSVRPNNRDPDHRQNHGHKDCNSSLKPRLRFILTDWLEGGLLFVLGLTRGICDAQRLRKNRTGAGRLTRSRQGGSRRRQFLSRMIIVGYDKSPHAAVAIPTSLCAMIPATK